MRFVAVIPVAFVCFENLLAEIRAIGQGNDILLGLEAFEYGEDTDFKGGDGVCQVANAYVVLTVKTDRAFCSGCRLVGVDIAVDEAGWRGMFC